MQKTKIEVIIILCIFFSNPILFAEESVQDKPSAAKNQFVDFPKRGVVDTQPAENWYEAMITGNGCFGALVMGNAYNEQIIFSHGKLFMPWENPLPPVNTAEHLDKIRKMIFDGQYQQAADFVVELSKKENPGYDHKRWTDPLIPAFDLLVKTAPKTQKNYERWVDYETGVAGVKWEDDSGTFERKIFVSRADKIAVMLIRSPDNAKINCTLALAQHPTDSENDYWQGQDKKRKGIKSTTVVSKDGWLEYRCAFAKRNSGYEGVAMIIAVNGTVKDEGSESVVENADQVLVLIKLEPLDDFGKSKLDSMKKTLNEIDKSFDGLLERHKKIHTEIYNRVRLDLGGDKQNLTAEQLMQLRKQDRLSPTLLERIFDADRYTILSCSGEAAPTLQGIWTGTWAAPWSSDYTLNGNVESAIAGYLCGNMAECMQGFFDYAEFLMPGSRINAKRFYNCRGILIASRASTFGENNHFDETWPMTFWTAGAGWISSFFYDYWRYTGDKDFLVKRALPFMKEAAVFYEDFLIEDANGKYIFNPSYSPENAPSNTGSQACINATMDIAVARELLRNLISISEELNIEKGQVKKWKKMLDKMPPYLVNKDGALKEWASNRLEDNYNHRHSSQLYPLFNGLSPEIAEDPNLVKACKQAIEKRLQFRRKSGEMAFGLVQIGLSAVSLGDSNTSSFVFDQLAKKFHFRVLNSSHDQFNLFNVDIAGGFPACIIKSLVNLQNKMLYVMPAFPKEFPSGRLVGVRCRNQILINSLAWNPEFIDIELTSEKDQAIDIALPCSFKSAVIENGQKIKPDTKDATKLANIRLKKGKLTRIKIQLNPDLPYKSDDSDTD